MSRGKTDKVKQLDRMSKKVNHMDADADRMLVYAEALAAAEESERETRMEVEQAEARARVAMRAEANAYADTRRERADAKRAIVRAEEEVKEAVRELRVLTLCLRLRVLAEIRQPLKLVNVRQPLPSPRHQVLREIRGKWQLKIKRPPTQSQHHRVIIKIAGRQPLKPTNKLSYVSQSWNRVLQKILERPTLKPLEHPESSSSHKITTEQNQTREGRAPCTQTFLSRKSWEPIVVHDCRKGECSTNAVAKRDDVNERRVLAYAAASDEESIEDMVRRLERKLDEEFGCFERTEDPCPATAAAEVPAKRVPEAVAELEALEIENTNFSRSFVNLAVESARTRVPETTLVSVQMQTLEQIVPGEPPATSDDWKMEKATEHQSPGGSGKQKPPEMECYRRPPRAQDKNHVQQVQGCHQHLSVSCKGVLDILYLASGRGPECKSQYRFGAVARVREVHTLLAHDW